MNSQLYCPNEARRGLVRDRTSLNGIDYLEVLDNDAPAGTARQQILLVHCLRPVGGLTRRNVLITGGVRVRDIKVDAAFAANALPPDLPPAERDYLSPPPLGKLAHPENVLVVHTGRRGDFSTYTLRLVLSPSQPGKLPDNFDNVLSTVDFSFKVECGNGFDCAPGQNCPEPALPAPRINYLAKDFDSFRQTLLDRLSVLVPGWRERHSADAGMALVELLAYAADHLSYYQDAVATEAYLGTARRRTSVRRHVRLTDYFLHDGANARAWISLEVEQGGAADGVPLPEKSPVLSRETGLAPAIRRDRLAEALAGGPVVFETLHSITLRAARNAIPLYTWGDPRCCLPRGATSATLAGAAADLDLHAGDVLIFEEVVGVDPASPAEGRGLAVDADPAHRHVVRLDRDPVALHDRATGVDVVEIHWYAGDALPFPLCAWELLDESGQPRVATVALGNVVLADHGLTWKDGSLQPARAPEAGEYHPRLSDTGITQAVPYRHAAAMRQPAAAVVDLDPSLALAAIRLRSAGGDWAAQRSLLDSSRFTRAFVAEPEDDGSVYLRFGDGVLGLRPMPGAGFTPEYRLGSGTAGNVGAETLAHVVVDLSGITRVRNPLPARGGLEPEPTAHARLYAPEAFRTQLRAITEADYAEVAGRHPEVQRAAATRRWTGSWYTMYVTVDRRGGLPIDPAFEAELVAYFDRFRLAGYDVEIDSPAFVALDIALAVCSAAGYIPADVEAALLARFSAGVLPDGSPGFFHPDNFTFSQPVYLSQVIAAAMAVPGVAWVKTQRFGRLGGDTTSAIAAGRLKFARLEIPRLDNDPNAPENGRIEFKMQDRGLI